MNTDSTEDQDFDFPHADVIDSRDLHALRDALNEARENGTADDDALALLDDLNTAADYASDWEYGETLIADRYFEDYARELADDIGAIDRDAAWPMSCIDWAEAADMLRQDYSEVQIDGQDYWTR